MGIPGRAESVDQKKKVISRLLNVWIDNPELRLGQLISNAIRNPFYSEDAFFIREIELYYQKPEDVS